MPHPLFYPLDSKDSSLLATAMLFENLVPCEFVWRHGGAEVGRACASPRAHSLVQADALALGHTPCGMAYAHTCFSTTCPHSGACSLARIRTHSLTRALAPSRACSNARSPARPRVANWPAENVHDLPRAGEKPAGEHAEALCLSRRGSSTVHRGKCNLKDQQGSDTGLCSACSVQGELQADAVHVLYASDEAGCTPSWDAATGGSPTNYSAPVRVTRPVHIGPLRGQRQSLRLVFFNGRRNMHLAGDPDAEERCELGIRLSFIAEEMNQAVALS